MKGAGGPSAALDRGVGDGAGSALDLARAAAAVPTTLVEGRVVDAVTERAIRGALVVATAEQAGGSSGARAKFLTGEDGRFVFRGLPPGRITVSASKTGFLKHTLTPFPLSAGARNGDTRVPLIRAGAISGRVVDQFGEPIGYVTVKAVPKDARPGAPSLSAVDTATTDDNGVYVIGGLEPGSYLVTIDTVGGGPPFESDAVFFPAKSTPEEATPLDVTAGSERTGIDLT